MNNNNKIDSSNKIIIENRERKAGLIISLIVAFGFYIKSMIELYKMSTDWWIYLIFAIVCIIGVLVYYSNNLVTSRIEAYDNKLYIEKLLGSKYIIDCSQIIKIKKIRSRRHGYYVSFFYREDNENKRLDIRYSSYNRSKMDEFFEKIGLEFDETEDYVMKSIMGSWILAAVFIMIALLIISLRTRV